MPLGWIVKSGRRWKKALAWIWKEKKRRRERKPSWRYSIWGWTVFEHLGMLGKDQGAICFESSVCWRHGAAQYRGRGRLQTGCVSRRSWQLCRRLHLAGGQDPTDVPWENGGHQYRLRGRGKAGGTWADRWQRQRQAKRRALRPRREGERGGLGTGPGEEKTKKGRREVQAQIPATIGAQRNLLAASYFFHRWRKSLWRLQTQFSEYWRNTRYRGSLRMRPWRRIRLAPAVRNCGENFIFSSCSAWSFR